MMKKAKIIPVIFLALFFLIPLHTVKAEENANEYKINSEFKNEELKLKPKTFILDYEYEDVNGDNIKDDVLLLGVREDNTRSPWSRDVSLVVKDGEKNKYRKISIGKIDHGYNGRLFLGDFNSDKISDVFITLCGKENKVFYSLISFRKNKVKYLFNQEKFSSGLAFDIDFDDYFKVNILDKKYDNVFITDMSQKKDIYIKEKVYDNNGKIIRKTKGFSGEIFELKPVDIDKDGVYELRGQQRLHGICSADDVGCVKSIWEYKKSKMELIYLYVVPYDKIEIYDMPQKVMPVMKMN